MPDFLLDVSVQIAFQIAIYFNSVPNQENGFL